MAARMSRAPGLTRLFHQWPLISWIVASSRSTNLSLSTTAISFGPSPNKPFRGWAIAVGRIAFSDRARSHAATK
jgi:hypothetical protein